ncbi:hypothetical protein HKX54_10520 [Sulfitobacter sp. M57]|nr:hypothetical protein [Sulfitobacter sp. KE5]MDF3422369.1 hypothetical protein [Sulfitobacter sp. KE43]MDF3433434.1 hypothetical protein [Sulfitobacter sp. KE42]MDF3459074.1 hypothetical protein [Sulfitobacter sp. S74]MDF3462973.1 hypothetical protein [Sulfitobacter sp. Ks18]MDF3466873.1 hypothetical protein [Sulfitobacter sp. M05]MDF3470768.1 hypothetical protein [Sulfitobacter sp. M28]MDF3474517.1 hypothetical protein [Sulfitobacter sp. M48]MDF3478420.1 hypothetical protein [Sulfitobact
MTYDSLYGQILPFPQPVTFGQPALTDVLCQKSADAGAIGVVLAELGQVDMPIVWVQDYAARRENGQLYAPGLRSMQITQPILRVTVSHPRDVLWSMEEAATCAGLTAVIGEVHGAPAALDFTATKRLTMRAEASGVPLYLIRSGDPGVLSAARARWRVVSLPSQPNPHDAQAPGQAQWDLDLFRARGRNPGRWVARYDPQASRAADRLSLVPRSDLRTLETGDQRLPDSAKP